MEERIYFRNSRKQNLCGVLSDPTSNKNRPVIIVCHGLGSSKEGRTHSGLQQLLNEENISTFGFDFFGHGESEGSFEDLTISEAADDILRAIALVKHHGYAKIGLVGSSFGGMSSLIAASQSDDLFVLVLKSPVSNYEELTISKMGNDGLTRWRETGYMEHQMEDGERIGLKYFFFEDCKRHNGYEAAKKITIPTLIVHGGADDVVPVQQSKKLAKSMMYCELRILDGADHDYSRPADFEEMLRFVSKFIIANI